MSADSLIGKIDALRKQYSDEPCTLTVNVLLDGVIGIVRHHNTEQAQDCKHEFVEIPEANFSSEPPRQECRKCGLDPYADPRQIAGQPPVQSSNISPEHVQKIERIEQVEQPDLIDPKKTASCTVLQPHGSLSKKDV